MPVNFEEILAGNASDIAPRLLGSVLTRELDGNIIKGKIVEVEAYDQTDLASHSYRGKTERTKVMFGPAGYLYVYFTYGMQYCCNVVVGPEGVGAAILIRGIEPLQGVEVMRENRSQDGLNLSNGPAKLCQALAIDKKLDGHNLVNSPLVLELGDGLDATEIVQTERIGISQAKDLPWRFYIKNNKYVSRM